MAKKLSLDLNLWLLRVQLRRRDGCKNTQIDRWLDLQEERELSDPHLVEELCSLSFDEPLKMVSNFDMASKPKNFIQ